MVLIDEHKILDLGSLTCGEGGNLSTRDLGFIYVSSEGRFGCEFIHPAQPTDAPSSRRSSWSHFYIPRGSRGVWNHTQTLHVDFGCFVNFDNFWESDNIASIIRKQLWCCVDTFSLYRATSAIFVRRQFSSTFYYRRIFKHIKQSFR